MNLEEAISNLRTGSDLVSLAESIGEVASNPDASLRDIALGLRYPGFVTEQAAMALYRRFALTLPANRNLLVVDHEFWSERIRIAETQEQRGRAA